MEDGKTARRQVGKGWREGQVALMVFLLAVLPSCRLAAQSWRTITSARQLHGETDARVHVQYGAGRFRLSPGVAGELYRLDLRYDEDKFIPLREYDAATGALNLGVRSREGQGVHVSLGDRRREGPVPSLDLSLNPDIPLALEMELGAVEADVELGGLALRRIRYRTGASETQLRFSRPNPIACEQLEMEAGAAQFRADDLANANCARVSFRGGVGEVTLGFSGAWRRSVTADVNVGIGSLHLRLPRDVGVALQLSRFLASFDAAGFEKRGNMYYSPNYNSARYRLTLDVNASIGGVDVVWADDR
jgi:hypothetical protein